MKRKLISLLLCAAVPLSLMTACGSDESSSESGENIAMEELEYGATMRDMKDTKVEMCFDYRYFSDEAMKKLSDYFYAVQTQDEELFTSTQNEDYIGYLKANSGLEVKDFMADILKADTDALGDGLKYTYIEVTGAGDSSVDSEIDEIKKLMDTIYKDNKKDTDFSSTVKDAKFARLSVMAEANGKSSTNNDLTVYIFECTDGIYIFN